MNIPIAVTVHKASILTRSMITFGQVLLRANPNLLNIVHSLEVESDSCIFQKEEGLFVWHFISKVVTSVKRAGILPRTKRGLISLYYVGFFNMYLMINLM